MTDGVIPDHSHQTISHAIFWDIKAPKQIVNKSREMERVDEYEAVETHFQNILSSLRFFRGGDITYRVLEIRGKGWGFTGRSRARFNVKEIFVPSYTMNAEDVNQFLEFHRVFKDTPVDASLDVAMRRMNYAAERSRKDDHLIDRLVAFEALFLEDSRELRYRLSIRVATALAESGPKRVEVFNDMKLAYDLRSRVIHGEPRDRIVKHLKKTGYRFTDFLDRIDGYLRASITKYLECLAGGADRQEFIRSIDANLLGA